MERVQRQILELTSDSRLGEEDCKILDNLSYDVRKDYDKFISELILINDLRNKSLFLKVSSRNTLVSEILQNFCNLALAEEKIKSENPPNIIIVDSVEMYEPTYQLLKKYKRTDINLQIKHKKTNIFLVYLLNFFKLIYVALNCWAFTRFLSLKKKPNKPIILIDTFLFRGSIDNDGNFLDRYYTGHENYLDEQEKNALWFAPTLYGLKTPLDYLRLFFSTRKLKKNFFIKEAWLDGFDYLHCIYSSFFLTSKIKKIPSFRGLDVSSIVIREAYEDRGSLGVFRAMCNYRFFKKLSQEKIKISSLVNWFENHVNDRALNLSIRKYHQNTKVKGYQGFFLINFYATYEPTELEHALETVPHELHVINNYSLKTIEAQCPELKLKLSPAFRFDHLNTIEDKRSPNKKTIFIPFPGEGMTSRGVNLVNNCLSSLSVMKEEIDVYVKPHPSYPLDALMKFDKIMTNPIIKYTNESTASMYAISDLVIANGSVTCAEALALGIPVAISGNSPDITMNPIPNDYMTNLWKVFYNTEELIEFMTFAFNLKLRSSSIDSLFYPHTKDGAKSLFTDQRSLNIS